ncbi:MAG: septum formation initiator family protein [Myxococcota bacterium]|nr:septum formation initiator family protein [Myxococcota bacterium]
MGSLLAALGLTLISVADADGFRRYFRLRGELQTLEDKNRALEQVNSSLSREISALRSDKRVMERVAREELGFIRPGELVFNLEAP